MIYGAVEITTEATQIVSANCDRKEIIITNTNDEDVTVYIGMDENVTVETGTPFYANQTRGHARGFGTYLGPIYGIVASGTCDVRYWETT
jgi:hypothetical protein